MFSQSYVLSGILGRRGVIELFKSSTRSGIGQILGKWLSLSFFIFLRDSREKFGKKQKFSKFENFCRNMAIFMAKNRPKKFFLKEKIFGRTIRG